MRLDSLLVNLNKFSSRTKANEAIKRGEILYKGKPAKPSLEIENLDDIQFVESIKFVSNGGYKLYKALLDFKSDIKDFVFIDIGASNGGFTDCLFKFGVKKVYCVDVGESQLDKSLLDKNVVILDNFNARNLSLNDINERVDGITCDVSFISLTYIIPVLKGLLKENGVCFLLIKPQFECGMENLNKNGIVKNNQVRINVCNKIYDECLKNGLKIVNFTNAPIKENKNVEYIIQLINNDKIKPYKKENIAEFIRGIK